MRRGVLLRDALSRKCHFAKNLPIDEPHIWPMKYPVELNKNSYYVDTLKDSRKGQLTKDSAKLLEEVNKAHVQLQPAALQDYINNYIRGVCAIGWRREIDSNGGRYPPTFDTDQAKKKYKYNPSMENGHTYRKSYIVMPKLSATRMTCFV